MNLLLIPANYPYPSSLQTGAQNERCARILRRLVDHIVVVSPRPFIPSCMAFRPRWQSYAAIPSHHVCHEIEVYRPGHVVLPGLMQAVWTNEAAYLSIRHLVRKLNRKYRFDVILSFDLCQVGGLAWRLGCDLGIPAAGWATGSDIRNNQNSPSGRRVAETLQRLDMVFYQSSELLQLGAQILSAEPEKLQACGRHRLLSRGVMEPNKRPGSNVRAWKRATLCVKDNEVMVLYVGRVVRDKGLFGLVDALASNSGQIGNVKLVIVGANPAFDDTEEFNRHLLRHPSVLERVHVLPACPGDEVWEYYAAADIFAFPSCHEGMPNALLEAMISGLPAIAFDIPAIQDIVRYDNKALLSIEPFNYNRFFEGLTTLWKDPNLRKLMGDRGQMLVRRRFSLVQNMKSAAACLEAMT